MRGLDFHRPLSVIGPGKRSKFVVGPGLEPLFPDMDASLPLVLLARVKFRMQATKVRENLSLQVDLLATEKRHGMALHEANVRAWTGQG